MKYLLQLLLAVSVSLPAQAIAEVTEVDNQLLQSLHAQGVTIIDVRRPDEWKKTGIIENSHAITFFDANGDYDAKAWLAELNEHVKPEEAFVLICAAGFRSSKIAGLLDKRLGYSGVHNVTQGISAWIKQGNPVVTWKANE